MNIYSAPIAQLRNIYRIPTTGNRLKILQTYILVQSISIESATIYRKSIERQTKFMKYL